MNRHVLFIMLLWVCSGVAYTQGLGINTDGAAPHSSALLEVKSPNKGVLIPRVALAGTNDITTIATPASSLLVYNSATAGSGPTAVIPGFYYYTGTAWVRVTAQSDLSTSVWTLGGNAGTDTAKHFFGTTDNQPLVFKVNNTRAGLLSPTSSSTHNGNTSWGFEALANNTLGIYNTAIGTAALKSNTTGIVNAASGSHALFSNTEGVANTASGYAALYRNTTGGYNTASGSDALENNTTGSDNTASGYAALNSNTTGRYNTASGVDALYLNTTGGYNTAMGTVALSRNTTGTYNTALGYGANVPTGSDLTNATALGARAQVGSSNALVLGAIKSVNGAANDVLVGIGTTTPSALLHVETGTNYGYGLLVKGTASQQTGSVPDLGEGSRLMFYPGKAAFRAGYVFGTQWDNANVGTGSTALGVNTIASGGTSTATGVYSKASGGASTAMGYYATASGFVSTAMGQYTTASGYVSTVMGYYTIAKAEGGTTIGEMNDDADQPTSEPAPGDRLFQIGNGSDDKGRSNALTVLRNGSMSLGTAEPHASAALDLTSTSRGLLVPRMTQANRNAITAPATGLLLYQTDGTTGFYYWSGTAWVPLLAGESSPLAAKNPSASAELANIVQQQQQQIDALKKENEAFRRQVERLSEAVRALSLQQQKQ